MIRNTNQQVQGQVTCCAKSACFFVCAVICGMIAVFLLIPGAILTNDGYDTDSVFNKNSFFEDSQSGKRVAGPVLLAFSMALFLTSFIMCVCGCSQSSNTSTGTGGTVVTTTTTTAGGQYQPVVTGPGAQPYPQQGYQYPAAATQYPSYQSTAAYAPQGGPAYTPQGGATYQPQGGATYQGGAYPPQGGATYPPQGSPAAPPVGQYGASYNEPSQFQTAASVPYQPQAAVMPTAPPIANTDLPPAYDEIHKS